MCCAATELLSRVVGRVIVRCTAVSWGRSDDDYRVAETKAGLLWAACAKDTGVAALTAVAVVLNSV